MITNLLFLLGGIVLGAVTVVVAFSAAALRELANAGADLDGPEPAK